MFFLYGPLCNSPKARDVLSIFSVSTLVFLFAFDRAVFNGLVYKALIFSGMIGALSLFFDFYIKNKETSGVKVKDLRCGQVLVESESDKVARFASEKDKGCAYNGIRSYGLNAFQIKIIRSLYKDEDTFLVYKTFSLGPLMFIGLLITILTGNSLIKIIITRLTAF